MKSGLFAMPTNAALNPKQPQWCQRHMDEVKQSGIPSLIFAIQSMQHFIADPRVDQRVREIKGLNPEADTRHILNDSVSFLSPICCFIGDEKVSLVIRNVIEDQKKLSEGKKITPQIPQPLMSN